MQQQPPASPEVLAPAARSPVFAYPPDEVEFFPDDYFAPLNLAAMFPGRDTAPLEIDLGCGDGGFLVEIAGRAPERNFLGVERLMGRVRKTCRRTARSALRNVRVMRIETTYFLRYLLPRESASILHLMFPDPWPKRRHQSRRIFQTEFLDAALNVLTPGGEIRFTTDDLPYYRHALEVAAGHDGFRQEPWEPDADYPQTDFERGFRGQGLPIHRLLLRKTRRPVDPVTNP